jgi:hypothetical protein
MLKNAKSVAAQGSGEKTSLHSFMQELFFLGSKTKENTLIIIFSWEKQWAFIADLITLSMCFTP